MSPIIAIIVASPCVLGRLLLSCGQIASTFQPSPFLISGSSALAAFLQSHLGRTFMVALNKAPQIVINRLPQTYYLEVLGMLYEILNKSRREGMMAIEADIEDPAASPIFSKYPGVLKDERMTAYVCDYLRIMSSGNMAPHELEGLFDMELSSLKEDLEHPSHAVTKVADALPGFGIVAAVLGIVITMALLGEGSQAEIGHHVAAALVGTFLGILAAYGFVGPLAGALEHDAKEELN
ncbi:flagellar motor stator protein MotA, partial [Acinetobacter baumannii]|uniref:MotA/TolQ/ExbB proton channel family protein n=1 Tax=Acinetobacter baumannii TaxID=470 RepID=UPI0018DDC165